MLSFRLAFLPIIETNAGKSARFTEWIYPFHSVENGSRHPVDPVQKLMFPGQNEKFRFLVAKPSEKRKISWMTDFSEVSRREREIMSVLFASPGGASVAAVREKLSQPPGLNSVRTLLQILEDKGHVERKKVGRHFVYSPRQDRCQAGLKALGQLLDTFYDGAIDKAVAAYFTRPNAEIDPEEWARLHSLIEQSKEEASS